MRKIIVALAIYALAGEWLTTEDGRRVCRLTVTLQTGITIDSGFCVDQQSGFRRLQQGMTYPTEEGWVRVIPGRGVQFHTERNGWVP